MTSKKTPPSRRDFLGEAGAMVLGSVALTGSLPRVFAQTRTAPAQTRTAASPGDTVPTLVCVYLRGGADALNVVVPYTNKTYYTVRPTISIPPEKTEDEPGVVKIDDHHGLHPALASLKPFWDQGKLATVLSVGSPHPTRSHFDAQDFMEYGAPGDRSVKDGWLNRFLLNTAKQGDTPLRALAMQGLLPRSLRGGAPVLAVPELRSDESEGLLDLFDDVYKVGGGMEEDLGGRKMVGGADSGRKGAVSVGRNTIETLRHFWDIIEKAPRPKVKYPGGAFARRLQMIARVIKAKAGLEIAAVDATGWDTHQGEGSTDGSLNRLLSGLGQGLAAFANDLGPALGNVTVLVMTEFGRTVAENGNRGTDHGRGGVMLALGGQVQGGKVYGSYGTLQPKHLQDKRDLRVAIDFRSVFSEVLAGVHSFDAAKGFFPLFTERDALGLMKA